MRHALLASSLFALAGAILLSSTPTAQAESAPKAECAAYVAASNPALNKKWEEQMNTWLAQGKTHFVPSPNGMCAY